MAWNYRRRVKVIPGVYLNLSKSGISTSVGVKGASLTFSKNGTYLNQSIPGLGIYNRQKLSGSSRPRKDTSNYPLEDHISVITDAGISIESSDLEEITSQDMQGVKDAILLSFKEREDLRQEINSVKTSLSKSKTKLVWSYALLYGLLKRSIPTKIEEDISSKEETIEDLKQQLTNCYVDLEIEFDAFIEEKFQRVENAFKDLTKSARIWDITNEKQEDTKVTRSSAGMSVTIKDVLFSMKSIPEIKTKYEALCLKNANGADIYIYPYFAIMYSSKDSFAVIGLDELILIQDYVRFTETRPIPPDSVVIDQTWAKVNKNGSPDKRFKDNYQIPIVKYGAISLMTTSGLNEKYLFSNYEFTEAFGSAFSDYQNALKSIKR